MTEQDAKNGFQSLRFFSDAALERARERGEVLSVGFPAMPASAFANIALSPKSGLLFFFENTRKNIAEAALSFGAEKPKFFRDVRLSALEKLLPKLRVPAGRPADADESPRIAPKIFVAGTFSGTAGTLAAIPRWQMTRIGRRTFLSANVFPAEESPDEISDRLEEEYLRLFRLAGTPPRLTPLPKILREEEVGGNWYADGGAAKAVEAIETGKFRKIVLARAKDFFVENAREFPAATLLAALRERFLDSGCTVYFARTQADGAGEKFVGATPEMLLHADGLKLKTEAVAGTSAIAARGNAAALLSDEKERREHRLVVEDIAEKLRSLGALPRVPETPQLLRLPNVCHLRTPIEAEFRFPDGNLGKIAETLHPTPAMCGVPAHEAEKFIRETEPFPRENFSAPIGFLDKTRRGFFAVGIRCAKISSEKIRLYAASGLVAGSVPAKEFSEIDSKFSALAEILKSGEKL